MKIDSLWLDVDAPVIAPPAVTREQTLPFANLTWENFERLCFRLAHRIGEVEDARIYGTPGQAQDGIDLYVRLATGEYETWQCKRYKEITATDIEKAVTKFLAGDWASRTKAFKLAVASSMNSTELSDELENQRARCVALNVTFEPLDRDRLSVLLKDHPDLVDDFFDRPWVLAFNGSEAAAALSGRKLSREKKLNARRFIQALYITQFQTIDGGIPAAAPIFRGAIKRVPVFERYIEPDVEMVESIVEHRQSPSPQSEDATTTDNVPPTGGFRRREVRTKLALSAGLVTCDRFLLLGGAGFGKSAALRVLIHSLLSNEARFPAIAKAWGQRLPLLFSFAFLTRHFADNDNATIESALNAWLKVLGAKNDVLLLLEEMLTDERLLLLVDGLDEWQNREAAVTALTALTTYTQTRRLPLIATGRPLGFDRISDLGPDWKRANLLPLSVSQQREFAIHWFRHFHEAQASLDGIALEQAVSRDAGELANDLSEDLALSELCGVPLLLSVMIYLRLSGRVLPHSRLAALEELVKALVEDQPRRRAQAAMQRTDQSVTRSSFIRHGIEYLAYRIHQEPNSLVLSNERASQLLHDYFHKDRDLTSSEAEEWVKRVLELGQHEFGLLVPPQEGHIGLLHRIFQEYLAAKYLSRLSLQRVKNYCAEAGRKLPWHEITLTLLQLLEREDDVDLLIEELQLPVTDCLDEPGQKILLTRVAVANTNCSRGKARKIVSEVFSWIECGRWMPLRLSLIREVALGLQSEQVASLVAERASRWFPGRIRWRYHVPASVAKNPTSETISDLWIALHNCDSTFDYRAIGEALASFAENAPGLADKFLAILKESAEPELMSAALHALATGWPNHQALPTLLEASRKTPVKELQCVAILTRFKLGEHSSEVRNALVTFCKEQQRLWSWEKEIVSALATGWPRDPELKRNALERIYGFGYPESWAPSLAIAYLLQGCPGDDDVARMITNQLALENRNDRKLILVNTNEDLLQGFTKHPLIIPAAEAWLEKNAATHYSPLDIAVIAKLGGTPRCRQALLDWFQRAESMPACIISTLWEMSEENDLDVKNALIEYIRDQSLRFETVRWLPAIIHDSNELSIMLREILRDGHIFNSNSALEILVEREGRDMQDLWQIVETRIQNDKTGNYWRLGHSSLIKIWPENPSIRQLVKSTVYAEDMSLSSFYEAYGNDPEIRPLLDRTMQVLHEDLRLEFVRSIEPLVRRGIASAVAFAKQFKDEPSGEARTVAARAYARACVRTGRHEQELTSAVCLDFDGLFLEREQRQQAAIVALLELDRADLISVQRDDGQALKLSTFSKSNHNWEFVASVVEHWEKLAAAMPDIWAQFNHSPIIATELAKAGKGVYALSQTQIFENAVRTGKQVEVDHVRALITLHGRSALLRDLFVARLQHFQPGRQQSMMVLESAAYHAMASYLADHFHGDMTVGQTMQVVAKSGMIHDVGLIALCRGWPDSPEITNISEKLSTLIEADEPVTACLFASKADATLMAKYLLRYPSKFTVSRFGNPRDGFAAVRERLQKDRECREIVFTELKKVTDPITLVALAKLLAPSMRNEKDFRIWISQQLRALRESNQVLGQLSFDVLSNSFNSVEFALLEAMFTRY